MKPIIKTKRVYEEPEKTDGYRVLIDRLWPRGISKEKAAVDEWEKDLAPTPALRKWFGHEPARWLEFQKRYKAELENNELVQSFVGKNNKLKKLTLLYAGKDEDHTHALILQQHLEKAFGKIS